MGTRYVKLIASDRGIFPDDLPFVVVVVVVIAKKTRGRIGDESESMAGMIRTVSHGAHRDHGDGISVFNKTPLCALCALRGKGDFVKASSLTEKGNYEKHEIHERKTGFSGVNAAHRA